MLEGYPVVTDVVVRWGDLDLLGHVNNIMYLQYFETARIEYLMKAGLEAPGSAWREFGFVLASVDCRFRTPVTFPDTLSVGARISALDKDRMVVQHAAHSHKLGKLAANGDALLVAYDFAAGRRVSIPRSLRERVSGLEGKELPPPPPLKQSRRNA